MTNKQKIINRLNNALKGQAMIIQDDQLSEEDKKEQLEVIKELQDYLYVMEEMQVEYVDNIETDITVKGAIFSIKEREKEYER